MPDATDTSLVNETISNTGADPVALSVVPVNDRLVPSVISSITHTPTVFRPSSLPVFIVTHPTGSPVAFVRVQDNGVPNAPH